MNIRQFQDVLEKLPGELDKLKGEEEEAEKLFKEAEHRHDSVELLSRVLAALRTDWKSSDPGKYGPNYFFFRDGKKMWARELLDDPQAVEEEHEARLGKLDEAELSPCTGCEEDALIVGCYRQTYDSPDGDEWTLIVYAMCLDCLGLFQLSQKTSEMRFM